jgi:hypothetical protein
MLLTACASTSEKEEAPVSVENDPRIGKQVQQACFVNTIDSWSSVDNDDNALIVSFRNKKRYKLNLIGTCDPELADFRIAIIGKTGSSCVQRGDKLLTDGNTMAGMSCTIMRMYEWHPEKLAESQQDKPQ